MTRHFLRSLAHACRSSFVCRGGCLQLAPLHTARCANARNRFCASCIIKPCARAGTPSPPPPTPQAYAELVDLYRTLAHIARLPTPDPSVQGKSLVPAAHEAARSASLRHRSNDTRHGDILSDNQTRSLRFALSQYPRCPQNWKAPWRANSCKHNDDIQVMGCAPFLCHRAARVS